MSNMDTEETPLYKVKKGDKVKYARDSHAWTVTGFNRNTNSVVIERIAYPNTFKKTVRQHFLKPWDDRPVSEQIKSRKKLKKITEVSDSHPASKHKSLITDFEIALSIILLLIERGALTGAEIKAALFADQGVRKVQRYLSSLIDNGYVVAFDTGGQRYRFYEISEGAGALFGRLVMPSSPIQE